jgi:arylsulfatase A-like enzyme
MGSNEAPDVLSDDPRFERTGQLDRTCIFFLGDNGYFFGEHALGPERRFAYEEGIHSPFLVR